MCVVGGFCLLYSKRARALLGTQMANISCGLSSQNATFENIRQFCSTYYLLQRKLQNKIFFVAVLM